MKKLPGPIHQVTVPQMFSVSAIASVDACLLKAILKDSSHEGTLPPGPRAILGNISHELVEMATNGIEGTEDEVFEELDRILSDLLAVARDRLEGNPATAPYSDLPRTMTPLAWARKRRAILDMAYDGARRALPNGTAPNYRRHGSFRFENLSRDGRWVEVPIEVPELRLKGRMDILDRCRKEARITDIKSGRVEEKDGEIVERVVQQVRLYGLMASWLEPSTKVMLTILDGVERPVSFDAEVRAATLAWLRSKTDPLTPGLAVSCESLARVGPDCRWCDMRHQCIRYLREVPSLWASSVDWPLPLDVWGTVVRIDSNGDGLVNLALLDAGRRHVKVFRLRNAQVKGVRPGDRIWLFELAATSTDLRGVPWRQPLNFHEISDSASNRAWSLQVFTDIPDC